MDCPWIVHTSPQYEIVWASIMTQFWTKTCHFYGKTMCTCLGFCFCSYILCHLFYASVTLWHHIVPHLIFHWWQIFFFFFFNDLWLSAQIFKFPEKFTLVLEIPRNLSPHFLVHICMCAQNVKKFNLWECVKYVTFAQEISFHNLHTSNVTGI